MIEISDAGSFSTRDWICWPLPATTQTEAPWLVEFSGIAAVDCAGARDWHRETLRIALNVVDAAAAGPAMPVEPPVPGTAWRLDLTALQWTASAHVSVWAQESAERGPGIGVDATRLMADPVVDAQSGDEREAVSGLEVDIAVRGVSTKFVRVDYQARIVGVWRWSCV